MESRDKRIFFVSICVLTVILFSLISIIHYDDNEGFNPSDEGVVLSQSWRIIQGETPHKDFITIRPAGSGILHQLDFLFPFPLFTTAKIIALTEVFLYSAIWVFLFCLIFLHYIPQRYHRSCIPAVILAVFLFTMNNQPIFTWTTIDALLFTTAGLVCLYRYFLTIQKNRVQLIYLAIAVFLFSCAALCRQTFAFPLFIFCLYGLLSDMRWRSMLMKIPFIAIGLTPLFLYLIYLTAHNALPLFINQMTGRTELLDTGIIAYAKSLGKEIYAALYFAGFLLLFANRKKKNSISVLRRLYYIISLLCSTYFSINLFFGDHSSAYAFYFFWMSLVLFMHCFAYNLLDRKQLFLIMTTLVIAWTTSISIGDNSPRLFLGPLQMLTIVLNLYLIRSVYQLRMRIRVYALNTILFIFCGLFIFLWQASESRINYREWTSSRLDKNLGDIFPSMGGIKVNENTYSYFTEFISLYHQLGDPLGNFVMLPNNAFIYAAMQSHNPLPLDWIQHHEYIGAEEQFMQQTTKAFSEDTLYLFFDKIDSKLLYKGFIPFEPDTVFNHSDLDWLKSLCTKTDIESAYFDVYISVP